MDTNQAWLKNCYCLNLHFSGHGGKIFSFSSHTGKLKKKSGKEDTFFSKAIHVNISMFQVLPRTLQSVTLSNQQWRKATKVHGNNWKQVKLYSVHGNNM